MMDELYVQEFFFVIISGVIQVLLAESSRWRVPFLPSRVSRVPPITAIVRTKLSTRSTFSALDIRQR